jgi:hypothetical protein
MNKNIDVYLNKPSEKRGEIYEINNGRKPDKVTITTPDGEVYEIFPSSVEEWIENSLISMSEIIAEIHKKTDIDVLKPQLQISRCCK